jgi:putative endonuclease
MTAERWWRGRSSTTDFGRAAERQVARWLAQEGLMVIERNHRNAGGEIDIVARDGETLVFLEVKARSRTDYGGAAAAVDREKRRRLVRAARVYVARSDWEGLCRFDVVAVERIDGEWHYQRFEGAFEAE